MFQGNTNLNSPEKEFGKQRIWSQFDTSKSKKKTSWEKNLRQKSLTKDSLIIEALLSSLVLYALIGCNICNILDQKLYLGSGNGLQTPQTRRVSTLDWCVKSFGSDHKYWPPLETAVEGEIW